MFLTYKFQNKIKNGKRVLSWRKIAKNLNQIKSVNNFINLSTKQQDLQLEIIKNSIKLIRNVLQE